MFDNPGTNHIADPAPSEAEIQQVLRSEFDPSFYCERYRDINTDLVDPLEHYCVFGWKEGRDPCPWFSTRRYMERHADVAKSGFNPFFHYVHVGKRQGRRVWPADHSGAFELDVDASATLVASNELRDLIRYQPRELDPPAAKPRPDCLKLHWVVPDFRIGSGGHMTIFRLVRWLEIAGHECTIWITNPGHHSTAEATYEDIIRHFQTIRARVAFVDAGFADAEGDAVIATGWQTVARVLNATRFRQRFYLVQDHEPSFHPLGSHALAAEWTYSQDLACICASPWLAQMLRERYGRWVSHFWLAYDRAIYYPGPADVPRPDADPAAAIPRIALYARRASARRVVEFAFLALEHLAAKGVRFQVDLFGDDIAESVAPFPCLSHGILDPERLAALYRNADLGICFSATNYSLVPQEMMACGLPVVEIDGESTRAVFPEDAVTLTRPHPLTIADGIEALLADPERRGRQAEIALRWVDQFDWEKSAKAVGQALLEKLTPDEGPTGAASVPLRKSRVKHAIRAAEPPKVSVCIPTYNGGELLSRVVERVRTQRAPWPFEIIIVDSSSTDGSIERLDLARAPALRSEPAQRLVRIPKSDFQHGKTRNFCADIARGEYVAFITQDALPADEFWLYNIVSVLQRFPEAAGAFGRHLPWPSASPFTRRDIDGHFEDLLRHPLVLSRRTRLSGVEAGSQAERQILHFFSDNNACLRKWVWKEIPYPELDYGEDQAWADKIVHLGYQKVYVPAAAVFHSHNHTPGEIASRAETEAYFFAKVFGYEMYDFSRTFPEQLAAACDSDMRWARGAGVSDEHLARRMVENKARLYGRVLGMERARDAMRSLQPVGASTPFNVGNWFDTHNAHTQSGRVNGHAVPHFTGGPSH